MAAAGNDLPCACTQENWSCVDAAADGIDSDVVIVDSEIAKVLHILDNF